MVNRQLFVLLHRWVGLTIALFLVTAGLTGTLLAFYDELDSWLAPNLHRIDVEKGAEGSSDPIRLRETVARALGPEARIDYVPLEQLQGRTLRFPITPNLNSITGQPYALTYDEVFVDPRSAAIQGKRMWGEVDLQPDHWMPFVYRFHYTLMLGEVGLLLMGIVALLWVFDCFNGAYLTLPRGRPFLEKWKPAWMIKWRASFVRINLDLHRAIGLWVWALLFIFAWSAVGFNLSDQVYRPVMNTLFVLDDTFDTLPKRAESNEPFGIDWRRALTISRIAMADLARQQSFIVERESVIQLDRETRSYRYWVHSNLDVGKRSHTGIAIDADSGHTIGRILPSGAHKGDTISEWLFALHMGQVFGLPYRIFICAFGIVVATLSVTGMVIWWKKRYGRSVSKRNVASATASV